MEMTKIEIISKDEMQKKGMHLYPKMKKSSKLKLYYREIKIDKVQESFQRQNIHMQMFHAVQNELIDYLKLINPNLWPIYINKCHPSNRITILHEAARSKNPDLLEFILSLKPNINIKSYKEYTALHFAVKSGNLECVTLICNERNLEIDNQDRKGQTAVDVACRLNMIDIVKVLITYGADVTKTEYDGMSCLHHPMRTNNLELMELLIKAKCRVDVKDNNGICPMTLAVNHGFVDAFSFCLKSVNNYRGTISSVMNCVDSEGYSCLLNAIRHKQKEIFLICVKNGADVTMRENEGRTVMHIASDIEWIDIIPTLIEYKIDINSVDNDLDTPLHLAIHNGNIGMIECLLNHGAQVNMCNRELLTPLLSAAVLILSLGNDRFKTIVEMLYRKHGNILLRNKIKQNILHLLIYSGQLGPIESLFQVISDQEKQNLINSPDENGEFPLHIACSLGLEDICIYLVRQGAAIIVGNSNENLPIHEATRKGNVNIIKFLVKEDSSQIDMKNEDETNLIQLSAQLGQFEIFEYLFNMDIDIHSKDENGNNILISACQKGDIQMAKLILTKDFNIHMKNYHQSSSLHVAAYTGQTEMVEYLLNLGAELSENVFEQTPLTLALDNEHWETAKVFINNKNWKRTMDFRFKNGKNHLHYLIMKNEDMAYEFLNRGLTTLTDHNLMNCAVLKYQLSLVDLGPNDSSSADCRFHELMTMAKYKREKLMRHPLSVILVFRKWSRFGNYTWSIDFCLYILYFVLLNYLIFHFTPPTNDPQKFTMEGCMIDNSTTSKLKQLTRYELTLEFWLLIILSLRVALELMKVYTQRIPYFMNVDNYPFMMLYVLTLPFICNLNTPPCQSQWTVAPFAILISWMIPMFYIQNIHILGIPILMLKQVFYSMIKILLLFFNLMIGYTLAFYILNQNQLPFQNVLNSYMKTLMMVTGEIEFVSYFLDPVTSGFTIVKIFLISIFVLMMTITMMNLMIGLAVGDIDRMMEDAKMHMNIVQINYLSQIESFMPVKLQSKFYEPTYFRIERKTNNCVSDLIRQIYGLEENKVSKASEDSTNDVCIEAIDKRLQSIEALMERTLNKLSSK